MSLAPLWAIAPLSKAKVADLKAWASEAYDDGFCDVSSLGYERATSLKEVLEKARTRYRDSRFLMGQAKPARAVETISAEECNEFLRSLPPLPLYGDDTA